MKPRLFFLFLCAALLTAPLLAVPEPHAGVIAANRARLERLQKRPDQLARLRRDAAAFLSLPPTRQEQVLQFDCDLQQEAAPVQAQVLKILERYSDWLDRLPETDRQAVHDAANNSRRLAVVRELRDKEWMLSQPQVVGDRWKKLTGSAQADFLRKAREEDRQRRRQWADVRLLWQEMEGKLRPVRFADLDARDQEGVKEFLMPMLSDDEKQLLAKAEGNWPTYPMTLVELADRHPLALPGKQGPRNVDQLPEALKSRFNAAIANPFAKGKTYASLLKPSEGNWPKFATHVTAINQLYIRTPLPRELWACDYKSLLSPMQDYVKNVLKLTSNEAESLLKAEGHWPQYPERIQELAKSHAAPAPPWETALYGPPDRWDVYRTLVKKGIPPPAAATAAAKRND